MVSCAAVKRDALTWTLAIVGLTAACTPQDPTAGRESETPVIVVDSPSEDIAPAVSSKDDAPVEPSTDLTPEEQPEPEAVELPAIPYALEELPADVAAPWPGGAVNGALVKVVEVTDGDTIKVETASGIEAIRVLGINAPECDKRSTAHGKACDPEDQDFSGVAEYYGVEAWAALRDLIEGEDVRLACKDVSGQCEMDHYDRTLSFIVIDGLDVSEYMTARGYAWTYTQFPPANVYTYCVAEETAIEGGLGIWSDGREAAIARMNGDTRRWYAYHDSTCSEHAL